MKTLQERTGIRFNWEISVGTLLTVISFAATAMIGYGFLVEWKVDVENLISRHSDRIERLERRINPETTLNNHEIRISGIERVVVEDREFKRQVLETLTKIREDVAGLKAQSTR